MNKIDRLSQLLRTTISESVRDIGGINAFEDHKSQVQFESEVRFWLENTLVPSVLAVACGVYSANSRHVVGDVINQEMPDLIRASLTPLAIEGDFLTDMSKKVDPHRWEVIAENLSDEASDIAVGTFQDALAEIFS